MDALRTESIPYTPVRRSYGARLRESAAELWADKSRLAPASRWSGASATVVVVSLTLWLTGGRYVSTDDSYVHAAKLMVSTDVSGLVKDVDVREGQTVKKGQILFRLDPQPFRSRSTTPRRRSPRACRTSNPRARPTRA